MGIDTVAKRQSALGQRWARLPFGRRFSQPIPDGTIDQGDRQTSGFVYGGILAGELIIAIPPLRDFTLDFDYLRSFTVDFNYLRDITVDF